MSAFSGSHGVFWRKTLPRAVQYFLLTLMSIYILVPIVILIFGSLKTRGHVFPSLYPTHPAVLG